MFELPKDHESLSRLNDELWRNCMYRYGKSPAPQEGDYYADTCSGHVYIRHGGSWMSLAYHELSADVREAYEKAGIVLDREFTPEREETTKEARAIMDQYMAEDGPVTEVPTVLPTSQYLGITDTPAVAPEDETP